MANDLIELNNIERGLILHSLENWSVQIGGQIPPPPYLRAAAFTRARIEELVEKLTKDRQ